MNWIALILFGFVSAASSGLCLALVASEWPGLSASKFLAVVLGTVLWCAVMLGTASFVGFGKP